MDRRNRHGRSSFKHWWNLLEVGEANEMKWNELVQTSTRGWRPNDWKILLIQNTKISTLINSLTRANQPHRTTSISTTHVLACEKKEQICHKSIQNSLSDRLWCSTKHTEVYDEGICPVWLSLQLTERKSYNWWLSKVQFKLYYMQEVGAACHGFGSASDQLPVS